MKNKPPKKYDDSAYIIENPWKALQAFTDARIALGRTGVSLPTQALLNFQKAHAMARDAVHEPLDAKALAAEFTNPLLSSLVQDIYVLHSQAANRDEYIQRPDLGRLLNTLSQEKLKPDTNNQYDLAIVIADGLSSLAIKNHALSLLIKLFKCLESDKDTWHLAPISIVQQGRVAIGDDIGERLNAKAVLVFIGERPGLSSPDSLSLYLTWNPMKGTTDAYRNCISNIRHEGISYDQALVKAMYLLSESRCKKLSGVKLKERTQDVVADSIGSSQAINVEH